ncbi:MAG: DUF3482 domain-containing protein [Acidobacteria bacterium]|nr:DUF3482 domain-containing protein [Acidobacteriota bacterium]
MTEQIVLSLISHTNLGKTSMARTLLRQDVGTVADQPHVTDQSTPYELMATEQLTVQIWDTPGFGSVKPLLDRLNQEKNFWGWLMHEVVDRLRNRPLFCSVEAARHVRSTSDVVLYLVQARETPADAGYLKMELKLLEALAKPLFLILNHTGDDSEEVVGNQLQTWHKAFLPSPIYRGAMVLDSFCRHWSQEMALFEMVAPSINPNLQAAFSIWRMAYQNRESNREQQAASIIAALVCQAAGWQTTRAGRSDKQIFEEVSNELNFQLQKCVQELVTLYGLDQEGQTRIQAQIDDLDRGLYSPLSENKTGFWASVISGATGGLAADLAAGGMTFGGGFVLGALLGGLGGFGLAKASQWFVGSAKLHWRPTFLFQYFSLILGYWMQVAHHGRARGPLPVDRDQLHIPQSLLPKWEASQATAVNDFSDFFENLDLPLKSEQSIKDAQTFLTGLAQKTLELTHLTPRALQVIPTNPSPKPDQDLPQNKQP